MTTIRNDVLGLDCSYFNIFPCFELFLLFAVHTYSFRENNSIISLIFRLLYNDSLNIDTHARTYTQMLRNIQFLLLYTHFV